MACQARRGDMGWAAAKQDHTSHQIRISRQKLTVTWLLAKPSHWLLLHVLCRTCTTSLCFSIASMTPCALLPPQGNSMHQPQVTFPTWKSLITSVLALLLKGSGTALDSCLICVPHCRQQLHWGSGDITIPPTQTPSSTKPSSVHTDTCSEWIAASLKTPVILSKSCQLVGLRPKPAHRQCSIWPAQCFEQTDTNCPYLKGNFTLKSTSPVFH